MVKPTAEDEMKRAAHFRIKLTPERQAYEAKLFRLFKDLTGDDPGKAREADATIKADELLTFGIEALMAVPHDLKKDATCIGTEEEGNNNELRQNYESQLFFLCFGHMQSFPCMTDICDMYGFPPRSWFPKTKVNLNALGYKYGIVTRKVALMRGAPLSAIEAVERERESAK